YGDGSCCRLTLRSPAARRSDTSGHFIDDHCEDVSRPRLAAFFAAVSLELAAEGLEERLDLVARRRRAAGARDVDGRGRAGEVEGRLERTSLDTVERPRQRAGAEQLRDEGRVENVSGADRVRDHGDGTGRTRDRLLRRVQHGP